MTEKKIISLGKISQFISEIFRYAIILILLTMGGIGAVGIGVITSVIFFKYIQKAIPFRISINREFLELIQQKMSLKTFKKMFLKKIIYNIILLIIILFAVSIIMDDWITFNREDKIFLSVVPGVLVSLLLFQFYYFYTVFDFVSLNKSTLSQGSFTSEENTENASNVFKSSQFIKNNINWLNSLTHNEIIIISVIIGILVFLLFGYGFSETVKKFHSNGRYNYVTEFNFILGFTSFIITSGITYLFLNSKRKNR